MLQVLLLSDNGFYESYYVSIDILDGDRVDLGCDFSCYYVNVVVGVVDLDS